MTRPLIARRHAPQILAAFFACGALAGPAAASTPTQITISYAEKAVDFLPLMIASDAGYFKKHGIDATVTYLPAQEGIPALITGQAQMAGIGGSDAISALAQGAQLALVETLDPIYPYQFWARPKYASATALKGRRVGITSATGSLYAGTVLALKALGLKTSDVALTPLGSVTNVNNALIAGSVDAAVSHPPATYRFKRVGLVDVVDLAKKKLPSVNGGLWVPRSYIATHTAVVQAVVDAVTEALEREKSDRAYTESEMSKHFGITDKGELDFTYDFYARDVLPPGPTPTVAQILANIRDLSATNPKVKAVNAEALIDKSFVEKPEK